MKYQEESETELAQSEREVATAQEAGSSRGKGHEDIDHGEEIEREVLCGEEEIGSGDETVVEDSDNAEKTEIGDREKEVVEREEEIDSGDETVVEDSDNVEETDVEDREGSEREISGNEVIEMETGEQNTEEDARDSDSASSNKDLSCESDDDNDALDCIFDGVLTL